MTQSGKVTAVGQGYATVEILRDSACATCSSAHSCIGCKKLVRVKALNSAGAEVGDVVTVETPTRTVLFYAFCVFLLPLLAAIAAYVAAMQFTVEKYALLWALGGFAVAFAFIFLVLERRAKKRENLVITHIEEKGDPDARNMDDTI